MRPATYSVSRIVVLPTEVNGPPNATRLAESIPAELAELLRQKNGVDAQASSAAADAPLALTSTATIEENDLTLKVQLIDQHANRILWSHSYPGQLADTGQLVQEAADGVSRLLQSAP